MELQIEKLAYSGFRYIAAKGDVFAGFLVGYTHTLFWGHCFKGDFYKFR